MMLYKYLSIAFSAVLVSGCGSDILWQEEPYHVVEMDNGIGLHYRLGEDSYIERVKPTVSSIGSNQSYISIKRCISGQCTYYYVDKSKDSPGAKPSEYLFGPYSVKEFTTLSTSLGLAKLDTLIVEK